MELVAGKTTWITRPYFYPETGRFDLPLHSIIASTQTVLQSILHKSTQVIRRKGELQNGG